ncbi:hypothetical protein [Mycetocola sp. 2940]|uniref:hypothetical protein n=1 Tax=Mycetocola sp. 2940 TaxID=3156452 RepID=UPI003397BF74
MTETTTGAGDSLPPGEGSDRGPSMNARTGSPFNRLLVHGTGVIWVMVAGGILWILHGYLRSMTPLGHDQVWREDLGYSPILSTELFLLYDLPGVLALLLTSWATLSYLTMLRTPRISLKRAAKLLVILAYIFGLVAAAGLVILFVPPTTAGLNFGIAVLGLALFLAGLAALKGGDGLYGRPGLSGPVLMLLAAIGMFTLPLRPLMYAFALVPLAFGAAVFALYGAGWIVFGIGLRQETVMVP